VLLVLAAGTGRADDAELKPAAIDERHLQELAQRLPSADFHVVPVPPFVVIGDEPAAQVERRAHGTVEWAVLRLQQEYFSRSPERTIDIWLFKDADSYRWHSQQLFDITPSTPFGYYSEPNRALVMNISTGGGTLVHELVHPLMAANFAQCPAWFNEGLASLYEQCGERDGRIWGYPNWRLRGLQQAIRTGRVARFETLCRTTSREFYGDGPAAYYAQARYLCFYLQEVGKLREYYQQFRDSVAQDPAGYDTLQRVLQEPDMEAFQRRWEQYILKLKY
jgi:hypothetical protein